MIAFHFVSQTHVLEASPAHDHENDGVIYGLPVRAEQYPDGRHMGFTSVWKPTKEELATLNAGGGVAFFVMGSQPPCEATVVEARELVIPTHSGG